MQLSPIQQQQAFGSRFAREPVRIGTGLRYALEGDAQPGDVLALAGGVLVRDHNENGLADGIDVLAGLRSERATRGGLIDVRG